LSDINSEHDEPYEGVSITLPYILNILYRGRRTIVYLTLAGLLAGIGYAFLTTPLFRATAQIRPGIVSYSDAGAPVREWALKDVVHWFRSMLYWQQLKELPQFEARDFPPVILAEFIPTGPQYASGGDVITLSTLSADPTVAIETLDMAIDSFNEQARADSASSILALTIAGGRARISRLRNEVEHVEDEKARNALDITEREHELALLGSRSELLDKQAGWLDSDRRWRIAAVDTAVAAITAARGRLDRAVVMLNEAMTDAAEAPPADSGASSSLDALLAQSVENQRSGRVSDLLLTVNELGRYVQENTVRVDTLRQSIERLGFELDTVRFERDVELAKAREEVQQELAGFRLTADRDLPYKAAQLEVDLEAEQVRMALLNPLERVGPVTVTTKSVRPRRPRAIIILTFLAFSGSLFLVFLREYLVHNKDQILAEPVSR